MCGNEILHSAQETPALPEDSLSLTALAEGLHFEPNIVPFPLTPTLSPRRGENPRLHLGESDAHGLARRGRCSTLSPRERAGVGSGHRHGLQSEHTHGLHFRPSREEMHFPSRRLLNSSQAPKGPTGGACEEVGSRLPTLPTSVPTPPRAEKVLPMCVPGVLPMSMPRAVRGTRHSYLRARFHPRQHGIIARTASWL